MASIGARLDRAGARPSVSGAARLALLAAVASGSATLIYELGWLRALTYSVGATFPAITVVLTSFMLGLGLGSVLGGRLADRPLHPLRTYTIVELLVGLVALAFPVVSSAVGALDVGDAGPFSGRALVAGLALLPATTLMGTTFPLLSAALHADDRGARHVPWLYGANTLGATLGAILGGLVLPFILGVLPTLWIAGALNVLAALLAGYASFGPLAREAARDDASPAPGGLPPRAWLLLVLSAGSGSLIMLAELFWTRAILLLERRNYSTLAIEPSDAMTLVLVLVLFGNALGSVMATRLADAAPSRIARVIAFTWLLGGVLTLAGLEWPNVMALGLDQEDARSPGTVVYLRLLPVLGPGLLLGVGFPLLARLYSGALAGHGQRLGTIWWANTLGSVVGSVGGGWWLMPTMGADNGLVLCATLSIGLAAVAITFAGARARDFLPLAAAAAVIVGVLVWVPLGPGQVYRLRYGDDAVIATWEGWEATTVVWETPRARQITSNGRSIQARENLIRGGEYAAKFNPGARRVMLVGYGTGLFARGLLSLAHLEELDIVEIDGAQFTAARHFEVGPLMSDPRVHLIVDDALHYLAVQEKTFDLILVDSWGPDASPALYTREFHQRAMSRLSENGLVWAKVNPLQPASLAPVQDAARCTYPHAWYVTGKGMTSAILGSNVSVFPDLEPHRLPVADETCDPLSHFFPRRLRTADSALADSAGPPEPDAPGTRPTPAPRAPLTGYRAPEWVERAADATLEDLSAGWWRWALAYPRSSSPISDRTGERCAQGQRDEVWFLVGPSAEATRTCVIPAGKTLLVPVRTCAWATNGCLKSLPAAEYTVRLDGTEVEVVSQQPTIVRGDAVADNPVTAQSATRRVELAAEGSWARLPPLSPGAHTLEIRGSGPGTYSTTYSLQVEGPAN